MGVDGSSSLFELYQEWGPLMSMRKRYKFHLDAYTPTTIPMARLAEYLGNLAKLFGSESEVHFVALEGGSTQSVVDVEWEAVPKVEERLQVAPTPDAPPDLSRAYHSIDELLEKDNASAELVEEAPSEQARKVIVFPGRRKPKAVEYGPFRQDGTIDGVLVRIGGLDDMVPVHLKSGETVYQCQANHATARDLSPHLFGAPLRARGNGTWFRDRDGNWEMRRFTIEGFSILRRDDLKTTVERLRSVNDEIAKIKDPLAALEDLRQG